MARRPRPKGYKETKKRRPYITMKVKEQDIERHLVEKQCHQINKFYDSDEVMLIETFFNNEGDLI